MWHLPNPGNHDNLVVLQAYFLKSLVFSSVKSPSLWSTWRGSPFSRLDTAFRLARSKSLERGLHVTHWAGPLTAPPLTGEGATRHTLGGSTHSPTPHWVGPLTAPPLTGWVHSQPLPLLERGLHVTHWAGPLTAPPLTEEGATCHTLGGSAHSPTPHWRGSYTSHTEQVRSQPHPSLSRSTHSPTPHWVGPLTAPPLTHCMRASRDTLPSTSVCTFPWIHCVTMAII